MLKEKASDHGLQTTIDEIVVAVMIYSSAKPGQTEWNFLMPPEAIVV